MAVGYGQLGHVGWNFQASYGTSQVTSQHFIPIISEGFKHIKGEAREGNMYGRFGESPYHSTMEHTEADLRIEAHPIATGHLLKSVFGQVTTTSGTGIQTHEFIPLNTADWDDRAASPPATVEINRNVGSAFLFYDVVGSSIEFNVANGQLMTVNWNGMGAGFSRKSAATPTFPASRPFRWVPSSVSYNGWAVTDIRELRFRLETPLETVFTLGTSHTPYRIKRTGPTVATVNGTIQFASHSFNLDYEAFATARLFANFVSSSAPHTLLLDAPQMRFTDFNPQIAGAGLVQVQFSARAEFNTASSYPLRVVLVNTQTYY